MNYKIVLILKQRFVVVIVVVVVVYCCYYCCCRCFCDGGSGVDVVIVDAAVC